MRTEKSPSYTFVLCSSSKKHIIMAEQERVELILKCQRIMKFPPLQHEDRILIV
jgi:hypothetical protein